jgi:glycosyltransferase involved in cell wall biosynthesis
VIAGSGRDQARLEKLAKPNVQFLGRVPEADLPDLIARARGFVFPGREDFGIAPVEAQASGRPVIAYGAGGALDSIIDGQTGVFFNEATIESLIDAVERFNRIDFDPAVIRTNAEGFSTEVFERKLTQFINDKYAKFADTQHVRHTA